MLIILWRVTLPLALLGGGELDALRVGASLCLLRKTKIFILVALVLIGPLKGLRRALRNQSLNEHRGCDVVIPASSAR